VATAATQQAFQKASVTSLGTEGKPYTKPNKPTPNQPRTDQQHQDRKTHESSSSPEANPTSDSHQSDRSRAPVRPVKSTGQTGVAWAARDEQHPRVNSSKSKLRSLESLHGLEQDFGIIGTPHEKSIATIWSTKNLPNQEESKKSGQELL
jgi:hypothetical protein